MSSRHPVRAAFLALLALVSLSALSSCAGRAEDAAAPLVLEKTIPLDRVDGRIDHLAVDLEHRRLIVAELGNGTVDVIDLGSGKTLHRFNGLKEPQGVAYLPDSELIAVANGGDGSVDFYGSSDFSSKGTVSLGDDADNVRLDPQNGRIFVGHGDGMLAAIDPVRGKVLHEISLAAHPESFQLDLHSNRAYVNVPDAGQIAVIDLAAGKQVAKWTFPGLAENFPMALSDDASLLAIVFRSPPRLLLLQTGAGSVIGNYPTCGDADDVFFDSKRRHLYVSCGAGSIDVFDLNSAEARRIARIPTSSGARTALFVPQLDRLFVAARASPLGSDAAILVFRPRP